MAASLSDLTDYVKDELGGDLVEVLGADVDTDIARYLNDGLGRLGWLQPSTASLDWADNAASVDLPAGFVTPDKLVLPDESVPPRHRYFAGKLYFLDASCVKAVTGATLFYYAEHPALSGAQDSLLTGAGDAALVAFACYRAYKRIAGSRVDYRRYSTITGNNGVSIEDFASLSDQYYREFLDARDEQPLASPSTYYGD